jgi:hypothetical protein
MFIYLTQLKIQRAGKFDIPETLDDITPKRLAQDEIKRAEMASCDNRRASSWKCAQARMTATKTRVEDKVQAASKRTAWLAGRTEMSGRAREKA